MNYQDYIKYDPEKKQYTDSYGYVIDGISSKALPLEQRAQQPAKVNRVTLIDGDSGVDPIVTASGGDSTSLILDAKSYVRTTKPLIIATGSTNQAKISTSANVVTYEPLGTDTVCNLEFIPKHATSYVKFCSNYSRYLSIASGGAPKITCSQGTNSICDLTLESKSNPGRIIFSNSDAAIPEKLELQQLNGSSTFTSTTSGGVTSGDIVFVPRGLGIVKCSSWTYDAISSTGSPQTLTTNASTKVTINALTYNDFPAGFMTNTADTFQNTSGRTITLMVSACIRENPSSLVSDRNLGLYITRTNNSTYQYGQVLLNTTTDTTNPTGARALSTTAIITLANNESFSVWASTNAAGVVIGGSNAWNLSIITFRLMP